NHGHITVDGRRVDIPSYLVEPNQVIGVRERSRNLDIIKENVEQNNFVPEYLSFDKDKLEGVYLRYPERSELPAEINESLIVEFYSRSFLYHKTEKSPGILVHQDFEAFLFDKK